jgi:integrase
MKGNITRRGKTSWRLKFDAGRDPATGARKIQYVTVRGKRAEAEAKLAELLDAFNKGAFVEPSKITIADHVRARVAQWEAARRMNPKAGISRRTAERYHELIEGQIAPYLGAKPMQKLRAADIEAWHMNLLVSGRRDGKGGLSVGTVKSAHRLLSQCLDDAVRLDLAVRNVAVVQRSPKADSEEVTILTMPTKCEWSWTGSAAEPSILS